MKAKNYTRGHLDGRHSPSISGEGREMPVNAQRGMAAAATRARDGDVGKLHVFQTLLQS